MTDSISSIPFDYLRLFDAASALGVPIHRLMHAAGTGGVQLCVNLFGQTEGMVIDELPEGEPMEDDAHDAKHAARLARCTTPMPVGIYEVDAEIARFFEQDDTESVNLYEAYKFDERGWRAVRFHDVETNTGEAVTIYARDLVIMREEVARLLKPASAQAASAEKPLDERERTTMLQIIRALAIMAKLPERGAPASIERQLQELGFGRPKEAAIRKVIQAANALEPDGNPL